MFQAADKDQLWTLTGIDLRPLVYRGKFIFVAQIGSPQKTVLDLRDATPPGGISMDIMIRGLTIQIAAHSYPHARNEVDPLLSIFPPFVRAVYGKITFRVDAI